VAERRRIRYPRIYEHTARSGRRRYQVVFRTSRTVDATQRAASLDTPRDARDYGRDRGAGIGRRY
jgi:hypothetical protein